MYEAYFTRRLLEALTLAEEATNAQERSIHIRTSRYYRDLLQLAEKREIPRHSVKVNALLHHVSPQPLPVVISDLSTGGFRVSLKQRVAPGRLIGLQLDGLNPFDAYVIWQRDDEVGCKFLNELHPALLDAALALSPHGK